MPYTNIHVMSFADAAAYSCLRDIPPTIVISIDDKGFTPTPLDIDNPAIVGILKVSFEDVDEDQENTSTAMTNEDATAIVEFVRHYLPLKPEILIHCAAGVNRSAGVAAAIHRWLNGDDAPVMDSPYRRPNFLCYKKICAAADVMIDECFERERFAKHHEMSIRWNDDYDEVVWELPDRYVPVPDYNDPAEIAANDKAWEEMRERWADEGYLFAQKPELDQRNVEIADPWVDDRTFDVPETKNEHWGRRESFLGL